MNEKITLSICIATYNHSKKLHDQITKLLSYPEKDIEIVVSDNCSTDNTIELLNSISDKRLKLITSEKNYGPVLNYTRALNNGNGKYVMFLTDKDFITIKYIDKMLLLLKNNDFAVGYCQLDYANENIKIKLLSTTIACLKNLAYLSKHPTGYIYNNKLLKKLDIEKNFSCIKKVGYFPFEFISAELCLYKKGAILYIPFCITCKLEVADQTETSMTYSAENNNLFFLPQQIFELLEKYIVHLNGLKISKKDRIIILKKLVFEAHKDATYRYKSIIENKAKCFHYKVKQQNIDNKKIDELSKNFCKNIIQSPVFKNNLEKYIILIYTNSRFIVLKNIIQLKKTIKKILIHK